MPTPFDVARFGFGLGTRITSTAVSTGVGVAGRSLSTALDARAQVHAKVGSAAQQVASRVLGQVMIAGLSEDNMAAVTDRLSTSPEFNRLCASQLNTTPSREELAALLQHPDVIAAVAGSMREPAIGDSVEALLESAPVRRGTTNLTTAIAPDVLGSETVRRPIVDFIGEPEVARAEAHSAGAAMKDFIFRRNRD